MHTEDLATMDEQSYVKIVGRLKDMIIHGGKNFFPREVEEFLHTHPDILDVQVSAYLREATGRRSWPG
jgi:fatty-acyl-CoA synthase